jgi:hypothetical protein
VGPNFRPIWQRELDQPVVARARTRSEARRPLAVAGDGSWIEVPGFRLTLGRR